MDDGTDLSAILGNAPVQQAPSFNPIVTGGGDPFISPSVQHKPAAVLTNYGNTFSMLRYSIRNLMTYVGFFLAAALISLSTPRSLILQYIPNPYTSGGVVSYTGAGVLGLAAVIIAYVISTLLAVLI